MNKRIICYITLVVCVLTIINGCGKVDHEKVAAIRQDALAQPYHRIEGSLPTPLEKAQQLIADGKARKAAKTTKKWIKKNKKSDEMDKALFLQGEALFMHKHYYQAFEAYDLLISEHAASPLFKPSLQQEMAIGQIFLAGAKRKVWGFIPSSARTEGIAILDKVSQHWPGSKMAAEALMIQGNYYYDSNKYLEAQLSYQLIVDNYKNTEYFEPALLRLAESTHAQYLGPEYDTTCLGEATIRYEQYKLNFPELAKKKEIDSQLQLIRQQQALKEFETADFYYRTGQISAARFYWKDISNRWSDTQWAQQALLKLEETASTVQAQ